MSIIGQFVTQKEITSTTVNFIIFCKILTKEYDHMISCNAIYCFESKLAV